MTMLTKQESENCYRAAYEGFEKGFSGGEFDVILGEDGDALSLSSGVRYPNYTRIFSNVHMSDFGAWSMEDTTEDEFVDYCMECFGCIETAEEGE
jgi:hypothetical protein